MTCKYLMLILTLLASNVLLPAQKPFFTLVDVPDMRRTVGIKPNEEGFQIFLGSYMNHNGAITVNMNEDGEITSEIDTILPFKPSFFPNYTLFTKNQDGIRYFNRAEFSNINYTQRSEIDIDLVDENTNSTELIPFETFNSIGTCHCLGLFRRDQKVYALIHCHRDQSTLLVYDLETEEQDYIELDLPEAFISRHLIETTNNDIVISGIIRDFNIFNKYVVTLDSSFQFKNIRELPKENTNLYQTPLILYLGSNKVLNFTIFEDDTSGTTTKSLHCFDISSGETIWEREYIVNHNFTFLTPRHFLDEDGFIYLSGNVTKTDSTGTERRILTLDKYDPDGNLIWSHLYDKKEFVSMTYSHVELLPDGCIVAGGSAFERNGRMKPFVFMTDKNGCIDLDCDLSSQLSSANTFPFRLSIYPNPAHDFIYVQTEKENTSHIDILSSNGNNLLIKNIQGAICMQQNIDANMDGIRDKIDISKLPSGVFMAQIVSNRGESKSNVIKFVKQ